MQISDFTNALDVSVDSGDIELRPALPLARMDVHTRIRQHHAGAAQGRPVHADGFDGHRRGIVKQFGSPLVVEEARRNATLHGGQRRAGLTLRTDRGEITVREASPNEPPFEPRFGPKVLPKQLKNLKEFSKKIEE